MSHLPELTDELTRRLDVPGPRYTSYPTVPAWTEQFGSDDYRGALEKAAARTDAPLSVYVHIPFCRERCPHCGCNAIASRDPDRADRYLDAIGYELRMAAERLGARRGVSRLHLGGGTPTSLDERQLTLLCQVLSDECTILPDAEVAVEIDPRVTSDAQLALLRRLGFNRLSMGVQDFDPLVQRTINRVQSVELTRSRLETARELGYRSVNLDLIYGLPCQRPETWRQTLAEVVALRPDRIACFSFAYLPDLKPHQKQLPAAEIPRGPAKLELFRLAHDAFVDAGYQAIGMDHFALPDDELARAQAERRLWRDFQGYTTLRAADTIAFGITGISNLGGAFAQAVKDLSGHRTMLEQGRFPIERGLWLTEDDLRRQTVIVQLMCNFWVDLGTEGAARFARELEALAPLERDGLVERRGTELHVTPLGRLFVRNVAMVFDAYLERHRTTDHPTFSRTV